MTVLEVLATQGECRDTEDPDLFHPDREVGQAVAAPAAICARCPVSNICLDYALEVGAVGVWAGTTTKQRRRLAAAASRATRVAPEGGILVS